MSQPRFMTARRQTSMVAPSKNLSLARIFWRKTTTLFKNSSFDTDWSSFDVWQFELPSSYVMHILMNTAWEYAFYTDSKWLLSFRKRSPRAKIVWMYWWSELTASHEWWAAWDLSWSKSNLVMYKNNYNLANWQWFLTSSGHSPAGCLDLSCSTLWRSRIYSRHIVQQQHGSHIFLYLNSA